MRCSSFKRRLDAYLDGTLSPVDHKRVAAHIAGCTGCSDLLDELRSIDALLLTPRVLEPAPNLRFRVMADVRSVPPPQAPRFASARFLVAYVVFGWATIGAFFLLGGPAFAAGASGVLATTFADVAMVANAVGRLFDRGTSALTATMGAVLAADIVASALVVSVIVVRSGRRRAAQTDPC